jgi:hypothetical protein
MGGIAEQGAAPALLLLDDRIRDLCCGNYLDSARREWLVNAGDDEKPS